MTHSNSPDHDPVAAAIGLKDEVRNRADEIEAGRRLPADLSKKFGAAGLYSLCVPEAYGGLECPPATTARAVEAIAQADGSAGWCVFIGATSGSALATMHESSAREVFDSPETLISGVFQPRGRADRTQGGFRVTGDWSWGSGTENADWVVGGCRLFENGEPIRSVSGAPRSCMMMARGDEIDFLDTWHVSGLCGTGSTDFAMRDVFVPEGRAVGFSARRLERPLYAFPHFGLLAMGIAAVSLGMARTAIEELIRIARGKTPDGSARALASRPAAQTDVAQAEALLRSARGFFYEMLDEAWAAATRTGEVTVEHRRDIRLATTHATRSSAEAVDLMYQLGGGTSVYRSSPLQRIFRDIHVATQHMMVAPATYELTGRLLLGLDTDTGFL